MVVPEHVACMQRVFRRFLVLTPIFLRSNFKLRQSIFRTLKVRAFTAAALCLAVGTVVPGEPAHASPPDASLSKLAVLQPSVNPEVAQLELRVTANPLDLGGQLDLAVALCQAGDVARAQRLLLWLDAQPEVPPGIADVIGWYRRAPLCREGRPERAWWPKGFVAAGAGHSNNLNLGPTADRIFVAGLGQELELAASSRPLAAPVGQAEAGATWSLAPLGPAGRGWTASLYTQGLRYRDQPNFGLNALNALVGWRPTQERGTQTEFQAGVARLTLSEGTRLAAQTLHGSRLWEVGEAGWWGTVATVTLVDYAQRAALDARQLDLRLRGRWEGEQTRLTGELGWVEDRQVQDRPGGDRRGPYVQAQAQWAHPSGLSVEAQLRLAHSRDSRAYAEGLFGDVVRRQHSVQGALAVRQRLAPGLHLRLDSRWNRAQDALPLFTYAARTTMLSLEWAFDAPSD